ncbi:hypothetical protein KQY27_06395, partial [Methanobrevibacter sp. TMH8]|nr:hypothetical protein [Methanobrevibacter sp. TMH8]
MKYKHMAIIVLFLVLVLYSLSTVSAANQTISNTTSGGIDKGIKNTENQGTLTLNPGTYNKANQDTGISINKNIIIKGKGSTNQVIIDAKKQRNIFTIGNNINVTFINITFTNAYTTDSGGAIYNKYDGTIMTFINCTFINNSASYGGAIYNEGTDQSIINCNFINNTAKTGSGGAIYNDCNPNQSIINSTFINNNATNNGGAIYNGGNINQCIIGSTFINNTAKAGSGGAVYNNDDGCNQSIINSTFTNNTACINGGGIYNSGSMIVSGNNMSGNTATNLGNVIYNAGSMGILNLTYLNNSTYDVVSGKNVTIYATLVDDMNNPITGQSIRFYVNGTFVDNVNVIEGYADLIYTAPITTGTVIVTGTYGCIDNYVLNIANGQLKIIKNASSNSTIVAPAGKVGQRSSLSGVVRDNNGNYLSGVHLQVVVIGQTYDVVTNGSGAWSLNITPNVSGNFVVVVSWVGNSTCYGFSNSTVWNVANASSNSTINVPNGKVSQQSTISGVAKDEDGNPLCNVQLSVVVNGVSYVVNTNGAGAWSLNITPNVSGNLSVVVSWAGNSSYNGFTNNTVWNVANISTNSSIVVVNGTVGKSTIINGTARDENGNPLGNVQLSVVVNGVSYVVNTDGAGAWSLTYVPNVAGNFDVIVSWVGNATFNGFTNSSVLNVSKGTTNSTIIGRYGSVGYCITFLGMAIDENGNPLANVLLSVVVNGVNYTVNTNINGTWSLNYTPNTSGNFTIQVS